MLNQDTGFKVAVQVKYDSGPYVVVPDRQVDEVDRLLHENGIGHSIAHRLSRRDAEVHEQVIHIGRISDLQDAQDVLDSVQ